MASEFASPQVEEQKELENLIKDLKGSLRPFLIGLISVLSVVGVVICFIASVVVGAHKRGNIFDD